jgi:hypothetical protein
MLKVENSSVDQAFADWTAACAKYDETSRSYVELDHAPDPEMPDELRPRPGDDRYLGFSLKTTPSRGSRDAYDDRLVEELRYFREKRILFWSDIDAEIAKGRARGDEIIAAADAWRDAKKRRAAELTNFEDLLGELIVPADEAAMRIIAAPPSLETLKLKMDVLSHYMDTEWVGDAGETPPVAVTIAIALDVLAMNRAGEGDLEVIARATV